MHRIIGLDVGADSVKLVALESGFRGFAVKESRAARLDGDGEPGERLKRALEELGPLGEDTVAVALPGAQVASHVFTLPFTDARRIEQVLPAEVEGVTPFDLDEVVWDHAVLSQKDGKSEVLVGVVRKAALRELLDGLSAAGCDPRVVTYAPLALAALDEKGALERPAGTGEAPAQGEPVLVLEAGPGRADAVLVAGGQALLARAMAPPSAALWEGAKVDPAFLERLLAPLLRELKITLRTRPRGSAPVARVAVAGDLAELPGALERISEELGLPVAPLELHGPAAALPEGSPTPSSAARALGLALRAQQPRGRLNFRKAEFAFTKDLSQVRGHVVRLAVAVGVVLLLSLGLAIARLASLSSQAQDYDDALCAATKKHLGECLRDYRMAVSRMSGGQSKAAGIPRVSSSEVLAEIIAHLPDNALPLIDDLEVSTTTVRLKGVAESFGQVDQVIAALKTDKCFGEIKQPRVEKQRDSQKVNFSLDFTYTCSGETTGGGA